MNSRERFLKAINREYVDRVPIDLGGYLASFHRVSYKNLIDYLNIEDTSPKKPWDRVQQIVDADEIILNRFNIDTRHIRSKAPVNFKVIELQENAYIDEWGIKRKGTGLYYDIVDNPLRFKSAKELGSYNWPNPLDPGRYEGLRKEAKNLCENTEYAIVADPIGYGFVELGCAMRGFDIFFMDLITQNDFFKKFIDIVFKINVKMWELYLNEIGDYVQAVWTCDDFGIQTSMMFSPDIFRSIIKPIYKEYIKKIKSFAKVKVIHHTCGSVFPIIKDLSEIGIDVLNPLQPLAKDMSPEKVKKEYGSIISFHGAIDVQKLLINGTPEDIAGEVKKVASILGNGGGYILAPGHNIQPDVRPENVIALFDSIFI